ncbi:unnamed protein product [Orchesella dallaii]|uniref:BTB domain-containing protein n=1 Tax=Orchesella dallaii TaxID=48710 RepID=A0ABP1QD28_9HEXA
MNQIGNAHCRWEGASGYCLFHGRRCPENEEDDGQSPSRRDLNDFTGCVVSTAEVTRGEPVKTIWCLKNISTQSNLEALINTSYCIMNVGDGPRKMRLRFYLELFETTVAASPCLGGGGGQQQHAHLEKFLSLGCAVLSGGEDGKELTFVVKVDRLLEGTHQFQMNVLAERAIAFKSEEERKGKLIEKLFLPYMTAHIRPNGQKHRESYCFDSSRELCFGITVIPLHSSAAQGNTNERNLAAAVATSPTSISTPTSSPDVDVDALAQDIMKMLMDENNFADMVLETKDGMDINAHKFILAARSPVMKQIIQDEAFEGTIQLDFDINPTRIILRWMYTGKLGNEPIGEVVEDVVLAAEKYQLSEMLKALDKEMISACNPSNMFQLFEIAKKNEMRIAMDQITAFIKG